MIALLAAIMSGLGGVVIGAWANHRWENRVVDHRWYCGREHKANLPCEWRSPPAPRSVIEVRRGAPPSPAMREMN